MASFEAMKLLRVKLLDSKKFSLSSLQFYSRVDEIADLREHRNKTENRKSPYRSLDFSEIHECQEKGAFKNAGNLG